VLAPQLGNVIANGLHCSAAVSLAGEWVAVGIVSAGEWAAVCWLHPQLESKLQTECASSSAGE
jgi:hypothetical protein